MSEWLEVGADNYVLVTEGSLLNTGLIVGSEQSRWFIKRLQETRAQH